MKIYILTDLEGVGGVVSSDQTGPGGYGYEKARDWLTAEVNACVEGAIEGGATDILILDGHGANNANNIRYENLHPNAKLIQGSPWAGFPPLLDESYDGLIQIGAHAMSGTLGAVLEHTENSKNWVEMTINGQAVGEIAFIAAAAGDYGVPFIMVSGDDKACAESQAIVPGIETAVVKQGLTRHSAVLFPRQTVEDLIRTASRRAVSRAKSISPFVVSPPVAIEVEYLRTETLDRVREREGVTKLSSRRVRYEGRNVIEAAHRWLGG